MPTKILCITDPATHQAIDSTVELYARLSSDPRVILLHTHPSDVSSSQPARACLVPSGINHARFLELDSSATTELTWEAFDLIVHRADEPFPEGYIENLISLEKITRFAASPLGMSMAIGREFGRRVAGSFLPDWIATRDVDEAIHFIERHTHVVAKKERSYGGKGVFKITRAQNNWQMEGFAVGLDTFPSLHTLLEKLFSLDPLPFEFVRFLPRVHEGDKRILVLEGGILGAYLRLSTDGGWINNGTIGGTEVLASVEPHEKAIIESTWPRYQALGLPVLGYDFLTDDDGKSILSEINAGNVGGFGRLENLGGAPALSQLVEWLIARAKTAANAAN